MGAAPHEKKKSITWGGNGNVGVIVQKPHYASADGYDSSLSAISAICPVV